MYVYIVVECLERNMVRPEVVKYEHCSTTISAMRHGYGCLELYVYTALPMEIGLIIAYRENGKEIMTRTCLMMISAGGLGKPSYPE